MSYRVEFHASALAQWETQTPDRDEPSFRQCTFGGLGLLSFHVDDDREQIRIFDVTWVG